MKLYEVKGYTKTGIYAELVEAASKAEALEKGKALILKMAPGKIKKWYVSLY